MQIPLKCSAAGGKFCETGFFPADPLKGLNKYKSWLFSAILL